MLMLSPCADASRSIREVEQLKFYGSGGTIIRGLASAQNGRNAFKWSLAYATHCFRF